jgi:predicted MFS family arabinose efflux permease
VLIVAGRMTPALLLGLIAVMGVGQALSIPSFQAIQPELVGPDEIPQAALLNGANVNVARAVGPALGGILIAAVGPAATFVFNTLSFLGVLVVLYRWKRPPDHRPLGAEHVASAALAGLRYIRHAPRFATVLARSALFMIFASGLWALLPAVARGQLRLGSGGYGLLLGSVGIGAVAGAFAAGPLRRRFGTNVLVTGGMFGYALAMLVVGESTSTLLIIAVLMVAGAAWIAVQSTLNATAQVLLPAWTRARALAYFQLVFMGGQALGALGWGIVADAAGLRMAFVAPAVGLLIATASGIRLLPLSEKQLDMTLAEQWPLPMDVPDSDSAAGPVLVEVEWRVAPESADRFVAAMNKVCRSRRRTGANLWGLFRDVEDPTLYLETFTVATWHEHLRQHLERSTVSEQDLEAEARRFTMDGAPPGVRHLIWADAVVRKPDR